MTALRLDQASGAERDCLRDSEEAELRQWARVLERSFRCA